MNTGSGQTRTGDGPLNILLVSPFCEPWKWFSPFVSHRLAAGFCCKSFVCIDGASIFNIGTNFATEDPYTVPLSPKISLESSFPSSEHLTGFYYLLLPCTTGKFQPSSSTCSFTRSLLLLFTHLKVDRLPLLHRYYWPASQEPHLPRGLNFGVFDRP